MMMKAQESNCRKGLIRISLIPLLLFALLNFSQAQSHTNPYIIVLGTAQDGGYPQVGCTKNCCDLAWKYDSLKRYVVSLALVDSVSQKWWLFEATPDFKYQLQLFRELTKQKYKYLPEGIFITHAHIGHYTGLMELGREVMDTREMPVFVLPRMASFLQKNGPWSQLIRLKNIIIHPLYTDSVIALENNISIETFTVPHRDEYSETAGFRIITPQKKYLFIPDINKWDKWDRKIVAEVKNVDVAFLDGTFYSNNELPGRKIEEVPHPFIPETMELFKNEDAATRSKIYFIHFNHTNPVLWDKEIRAIVNVKGFHISAQGEGL